MDLADNWTKNPFCTILEFDFQKFPSKPKVDHNPFLHFTANVLRELRFPIIESVLFEKCS